MRRLEIVAFALLLVSLVGQISQADVVINEFQYDDAGTDDREFIELYNNGAVAVDISGWTVAGRDNVPSTSAPVATIPAATILAPGGYYVIGQTGVPNVNLTIASFLENDSETVELWQGAFGTSTIADAVVYEGFRGPTAAAGTSYGTLSAPVAAHVGGATYWGVHTGTETGAPAGRTTTTIGRYVDGVDTANNGRDLGLRPSTPGTANSVTTTSQYSAPDVDALADGTVVSGHSGGFVGARVITPGTVSAGLNPNAIPAPPNTAKAIVAWDNSGGGNSVVSNTAFAGAGQSYLITAFLDTTNIPLNSNTAGTTFRGSEFSYFGLGGSIDASAAIVSISGAVGLGAGDSANGLTGVAWVYEKVGETATGNNIVSEKLYLIDAGDGGNMNTEPSNLTADEWAILATFDLSTTPSAWHTLGISIDAAGNGVAQFGTNQVAFTTATGLYGSFYVGYRENTQAGAVTVPSYIRPATFAYIPEPGAVLFGGMVCLVVGLATGGRRLLARLRG
jgi:Lamin Tail Domain